MAAPDPSQKVDLALVLAVDCSSSVDPVEFRIQMEGIAAALRHPALQDAIAAGREHCIALTLVLWSGARSQSIAMPWQLLATEADLEAAAAVIAGAEREWQAGGTALAIAIDFAAGLLTALPFAAKRRVIDVSGDGIDNVTGMTEAARDRAVAQGITINGLPITKGSQLLPIYYKARVIGGRDAFVQPAPDLEAFPAAILRKLLREIGNPLS
ncbi:DUF1194 domain-containing protein [Dongia sp. agr-C8]